MKHVIVQLFLWLIIKIIPLKSDEEAQAMYDLIYDLLFDPLGIARKP